MGTRGYRAYRFRARYYVFWNRYDSYPEGLGNDLVQRFPTDATSYIAWLKARREECAEWERVLVDKVLSIPLEDISSCTKRHESRHSTCLDVTMTPSFLVPSTDWQIEYVYIIDLDHELFICNNGAHFNLANFPKSTWLKSIALSENETEILLDPSCTPVESTPFRPRSGLPLESNAIAIPAPIQVVQAKNKDDFLPKTRASATFFCKLWQKVRRDLSAELPYAPIALKPEDFAFRELVFAILSLAAGLNGTVELIDQRQIKNHSEDQDWITFDQGKAPHAIPTIASKVGLGFHQEGLKAGSAPTDTTYWFYNALIYLSDDLSSDKSMERAIIEAVKLGRATSNSFHAILISIRHIVLLRWNGNVLQRTDALPLLRVFEDDDSSFSAHCVIPVTEGTKMDGERVRKDTKDAETKRTNENVKNVDRFRYRMDWNGREKTPNPGSTHEKADAILDSSFFGLMHLLEASVTSSLPLASGSLPTEICEMILDLVDMETLRVCAMASKKFHQLCCARVFVTRQLRLYEYTKNFEFWDTMKERHQLTKLSKDGQYYAVYGFHGYGYKSPQPSFLETYKLVHLDPN